MSGRGGPDLRFDHYKNIYYDRLRAASNLRAYYVNDNNIVHIIIIQV